MLKSCSEWGNSEANQTNDMIKRWVGALQDDCDHLQLPIKASERFHFIKVKEPQERILCYKYICIICLMRTQQGKCLPASGTRKLYIYPSCPNDISLLVWWPCIPKLTEQNKTNIKIKQAGFRLPVSFFFNMVFYEVMKTLIVIQMFTLSRWQQDGRHAACLSGNECESLQCFQTCPVSHIYIHSRQY